MKRLLCMAFALGGMLSVALSQGTITCGTGDDASNLYPFNTNTASSWHEMIFDKTEVSDAAGCKITKVAFQRSSSSTQQTITAAPLQIYMGERTTSTHANVSDWTALADLTLVYNSTSQVVGNVAANAWQTFTLMGDGFAYSGEGHLVVVVVKTTTSTNTNSKWLYSTATNATLYKTGTASHPGTANGTRTSYRANTQFTYANCCSIERTGTMEFRDASNQPVTDMSYTIGQTFTKPTLYTALTPAPSGTPTYSSSDESIATVGSDGTVTFTGQAGTVTITATYAKEGNYCPVSASYTITVSDGCIVIGTGLSSISSGPIYSGYKYNYNQMLYTPAEIGTAGHITQIAFNAAYDGSYAHTVEVYIGETDKTAFTSGTDFVDPTTLTLAYTGTWTIATGWNYFPVDYQYSGLHNLVIAVKSGCSSYDYGLGFYYTTTAASSMAYVYSDSYEAIPSNFSSMYNSYTTNRPHTKICIEPCTEMPTFTFGNTSAMCYLGSSCGLPLTNSSDAVPTFSSSDGNIATVDASGNVTTLALGSTTITAVIERSGDVCPAIASYDLQVICPAQIPTAQSAWLCDGGAVELTATVVGDGELRWYDAVEATTHIATGESYTPTVATTTTFYVGTYNTEYGCSSSRVPATAHVFEVTYGNATQNINGYVNVPMYGYPPEGSHEGATFTSTNIPAWLTLNPDGSFTGTPTTTGSGSFIITATNGTCTKTITINWTVVANTLSCCDPAAFYIYQSGKPMPLQMESDGYYYADVCLGTSTQISVTPLANCTGYTYNWRLASSTGGLITEVTNQSFTYTYDRATGYNLTLTVNKSGTSVGCPVSIPIRVRVAGMFQVATRPSFDLCEGQPFNIYVSSDGIGSIDVVRPNGGSASTLGVTDTVFLPDGTNCSGADDGCYYRSSVTFADFSAGATISDENDLLYLMINMEHSYIGDIYITLTCPNNTTVPIMRFGGTNNSTDCSIPSEYSGWLGSGTTYAYFGQCEENTDYSTDYCDNTNGHNQPGVGWNYCWSQNTERGYEYANSTNSYVYENITNSTVDSSNMTDMTQIYKPEGNFNDFIGCPLNGTWTITVMDGYMVDNGYLFHWELGLNEELLPDSWTYTVDIDSAWVDCGWASSKAGVYMEITPPSDFTGTATCDLSIRDEYGCISQYDNIVTVTMHEGVYHTEQPATTCEPYTWARNGVTYSESDTVVDMRVTQYGCPDYDTLILKIADPKYDTLDQQACQSYTWNVTGQTYTSDVTVTDTLKTVDNCDSILTLNLSIRPALEIEKDTAVCPITFPFTWYNIDFNGPRTDVQNLTTSDGCDSTVTLTVTQLDKPVVSIAPIADSCPKPLGENYMVLTTVSGGTEGYSYSWSGDYTGTDANATIPSSGACDSYTAEVIVTDSKGCMDTADISFNAVDTENPTFEHPTTATDAILTGEGCKYVVPDILAILDPSDNCSIVSQTQTPAAGDTILATTTVSVVVIDECNQTITTSVVVNVPDPIKVELDSVNHHKCWNDALGNIFVTVSDGNPTYTYSWNNGATTEDLTGLEPGPYSLVVTDQNGCTATLDTSIEEPTRLVAAIDSARSLKCYHDNSGAVYASVTGGVTPYMYSWNSGVYNTEDIENVAAGTYTLIVTDNNGCTSTADTTIVEPAAALMAVVDSVNDLKCYKDSTGAVYVTVSGGTEPYTYNWNAGTYNTEDIEGLLAGTYTLEVTDAHGCTATVAESVAQPDSLVVEMTVPSSGSCPLPDGDNYPLSSTVTGGTSSYVYQWTSTWPDNHTSTGTGATFSITSDGHCHEYTTTILVTDQHGCTASDTKVFASEDNVAPTFTDIMTVPLSYAGSGCKYIVPDLITPMNIHDNCAIDTIIQVPAKDSIVYGQTSAVVTIVPMCGNTLNVTVNLTVPDPITFEIDTVIPVSCYGTSDGSLVIANVHGGDAPYRYIYNGDTNDNGIFTGLSASDFAPVVVIDNNGCTGSLNVEIESPTRLVAAEDMDSHVDVDCFGNATGSVQVNIVGNSGTPGYTFIRATDTNNTGLFTSLFVGEDTVKVVDANGCETSVPFEITQPLELSVSVADSSNILCNGDSTGFIDVLVQNGTPNYTYSWNDGEYTTEDIDNLHAGVYSLLVTDAHYCQKTITIKLSESPAMTGAMTIKDLDCKSDGTGEISLTVSGGTPYSDNTYRYLWSNGYDQQNISGLQAGEYIVTITDSNGCTLTLNDTVNEPDGMTLVVSNDTTICKQPYGVQDIPLIAIVTGGSGSYTYSWSNGSTAASQTISNPTASDVFIVTVKDVNECTLTDSIELIVNYPTESTDPRTHCDNQGASYYWPISGAWNSLDLTQDSYTTSYRMANANSVGCDSTIVLQLTILRGTSGTEVADVCDSYTWIRSDGTQVTYTESNNTDIYHTTNVAGCDSATTINLIVRHSTTGVDVISECDSVRWTGGTGSWYYETTTEPYPSSTFISGNAQGCDSTVYLHLTIRRSSSGIDFHDTCDVYTWPMLAQTYTSSTNEPTVTLPNANQEGCDSTVTLNLTIRYSTVGVDSQQHCNSYTWPTDDSTYTASTNIPSVLLSGANAAGCDSTVTLNLVINYNDTIVDDTIAICENTNYTWNDEVFDTVGTYTHVFVNRYGCDSVVTFTLLHNDTNHVYIYDTCGYRDLPWTYNDRIYDFAVEDDLFELENIFGCDSIVHYYLQPIWMCEEFLQFPSVVTPNGDGLNDRFVIINLVDQECYPKNKLSIYNRWGFLMYERENIKSDDEFWDPSDVPAGTYFFRFDGYGFDAKVERRGSFEIVK